jgi:hypothetical protein
MEEIKLGMSVVFGPAMVTWTPNCLPASRNAGWSWAMKSGRLAWQEIHTYSSWE